MIGGLREEGGSSVAGREGSEERPEPLDVVWRSVIDPLWVEVVEEGGIGKGMNEDVPWEKIDRKGNVSSVRNTSHTLLFRWCPLARFGWFQQ